MLIFSLRLKINIKKMPNPRLKLPQSNNVSDLFGYMPAVLKEYADYWCIEYYVKHPVTQELIRRREKVQSYKTRYGVREARKLLRVAVSRLNLKLSQGWTPFFVHEDGRLLERLPAVIEKFLKEKQRDLRPNTMRSYNSMIGNELLRWAKENYPVSYQPLLSAMYTSTGDCPVAAPAPVLSITIVTLLPENGFTKPPGLPLYPTMPNALRASS